MWTDSNPRLCRAAVLAALALLAGCEGAGLAPIEQKSTSAARKPDLARKAPPPPNAQGAAAVPGTHKVVAGETLYAIAWRYGLDARDLGRWNRLDDFNRIFVGQELRLRAPPAPTVAPKRSDAPPVVVKVPAPTPQPPETRKAPAVDASGPVRPPASATPVTPRVAEAGPAEKAGEEKARDDEAGNDTVAPEPRDSTRNAGGVAWQWPTSGASKRAKAASGAAGLDIRGERGQSVLAAADGQVVYSGNGLRGYGQLIIVKHNDTFLSAYAHNDKLLVSEGARVKAGQAIAHMGDTEADEVMLHFEIRKAGVAVDPTQYLPAR